jgi:very-short-patch-repair endonuclease
MGERVGEARRNSGIAKGDRNPNYGTKARPWLEGDNHPFRQWHRANPDFADRQRGANNPIHRVHHLYSDSAYLEAVTRGLKAHADERRGSTYEKVYGTEKATEYKHKLRLASPTRMAKFHRKETAPERVVREMLEGLPVVFVPQAPVGHYTVDFLLPTVKVVIQADGDFWHAHPETYGEGEGCTPLSQAQQERRRLDASCDSFLRAHGYTVLRLWERDLHGAPQACLQRILQHLREVP